MSSIQRRRGQAATLYPRILVTDNRGNDSYVVDESNPIPIVAAFIPQRSGRAEVPGQAQIDVTRMVVRDGIDGLDLWAQVDWQGARWDIVTPPAYHHGTRRTRHWSVDLRERP